MRNFFASYCGLGLLLLLMAAPADAKRIRLKPVSLNPVPKHMCGFHFKDTRRWRIEKRAFRGNCNTKYILRYMDGTTYRSKEIDEMSGDARNPYHRIVVAFSFGKITQQRHELPFLLLDDEEHEYSLERKGRHWIVGDIRDSKFEIEQVDGFRAMTGEVTYRMPMGSGSATVGKNFTLLDNGRGTLMAVTGDDQESSSGMARAFLYSLVPRH